MAIIPDGISICLKIDNSEWILRVVDQSKESYKQILKATSVFGGVQIFKIVIDLLKSKIIALFLGPEGVGMFSLFQNPVQLISQLTGLGINTSAIRDVAQSREDEIELGKTVKTVRSWSRVSGLVGMLFLLFAAPLVSRWTFGSEEHAMDFRFLSLAVLFIALGNENDVILKGQRKIVYIAKAGVSSALCGLIASIPAYYFLGKDGIAAIVVLTFFAVYFFNRHYARKEIIKEVDLTGREIFQRGKTMASLGSMLVLASVVHTAIAYLTNLFIRNYGDLADVGFYQAGMAITTISIDMVYNAMAGDFYPRLSAVCNDRNKSNDLINQQAEVATLVCTPILVCMIAFVPLLIRLFLSSEFLIIESFIHWILLAAVFRAASYTVYYMILAKGNTKGCLVFALLINGSLLLFNPLGYYLLGLKGLGIAYLLMMCIYTLAIVLYVRRKYGVGYQSTFIKMQFESIVLCVLILLSVLYLPKSLAYIVNSLIGIPVCYIYLKALNERTEFLTTIKNRFHGK